MGKKPAKPKGLAQKQLDAIIAKESKRKGHVKYSRHYRFYYCEVAAT